MPVREWNAALGVDKVGVVKNTSATAVSGGAANLGGTTGVRVLVDDAVTTGKVEILRSLEAIMQRIIEDTYPPA